MKDESVIPEGSYCYTRINGKQVNCPYWGRDPSRPQQESGFCTFLDIGWVGVIGYCVDIIASSIAEALLGKDNA